MKINILSLKNLSATLENLAINNISNIRLMDINADAIPFFDYFLDRCKKHKCTVQVGKDILVNHGILEHFKGRVHIH